MLGRPPDLVAGKPFRPLFDETVIRIASQRPIVVGDRLDTDIEGARNCGADSLLVMTGVTDIDQLCHAEPHQRPDFVSWSLLGLLTSHRLPEVRGHGWHLDDWSAEVRDGRLIVEGPEDDSESTGLRVATSAAWAWIDAHPAVRLDTAQAAETLTAAAR